MNHTYDHVDYISPHSYSENLQDDTDSYLATTLAVEQRIKGVLAACDYVKAIKGSKKVINISFDEWGVWYHSKEKDAKYVMSGKWSTEKAPALLEEKYNFQDALQIGLLLITLMKNADRMKVACLAQLVNVLAPVMTETSGGVWRRSIFYPYMHASIYGRGIALLPTIYVDKMTPENLPTFPISMMWPSGMRRRKP